MIFPVLRRVISSYIVSCRLKDTKMPHIIGLYSGIDSQEPRKRTVTRSMTILVTKNSHLSSWINILDTAVRVYIGEFEIPCGTLLVPVYGCFDLYLFILQSILIQSLASCVLLVDQHYIVSQSHIRISGYDSAIYEYPTSHTPHITDHEGEIVYKSSVRRVCIV